MNVHNIVKAIYVYQKTLYITFMILCRPVLDAYYSCIINEFNE